MPEKKERSGGGGKPFDGKVDEYVGKVVPEHLLATVFACTAAGALLFFILMIFGFARSPEKAAQAGVAAAERALADARDRHAKTTTQLETALAAKAEAEGRAKGADTLVKRAEGKTEASNARCKALEGEKAELHKKLGAAEATRRKAEADLQKAAQDAQREQTKLVAERDAAVKDKDTLDARAKKLDAEIAALREQVAQLQDADEEAAKVAERAREAFDSIMKKVAELEEPEKRVALIEELSAENKAELAGTTYMARLDEELEREKQAVEAKTRAAEKEAKIAAKDIYEEAMRQLAMAETHEKAIEILGEAKDKLAGSDYEVNVHKEMVKREDDHKKEAAREVYEEVLKKTGDSPKAYEENLRAFEEALAEVEGTPYADRLEKMVEKKKKTVKDDVARAAWDDLLAQTKAKPDEYDENIAAAEDALLKAEGTRLEGTVRKKLDAMKSERLDKIGQEAFEAARAQLERSPKDHATNAVVLKELEEKAAGSSWEAKIAKMRAGEEKRGDRSR